MSVMQLLRTLAHLRIGQLAALASHRIGGAFENPAKILAHPVPAFPGCVWQPPRAFLPPLQAQSAESIQSGHLSFLNQSHAVGWPPNWNPSGISRLWLYNLHYFDWLWSLEPQTAITAACDWIDRHPPARGAAGWEPYPTSLRLMNWCCSFFAPPRSGLENLPAARDKVWASLYRQACWLEGHIESHLCGNHVLENAAALCVVGACFGGPDAARWLNRGIYMLGRELDEQFLPDGGHYERSPMYHSRTMYLLILLHGLGRDEISRLVQDPLNRGIEALRQLSHPDGQIALLNDSAWGIYNAPEELSRVSGVKWPPAAGIFALTDSGYFGSRSEDGNYILCDAGAVGPDHQPGHAHGDTLSFELSLRGHRVIVDSGVFDYVPGEMRRYCRSTRAHNTVEIDERDQAEFWGTFRVGRRPRVSATFSPRPDGFELIGRHDGYGKTIHQRRFDWSDRGVLLIGDSVYGSRAARFAARLHLHPACSVIGLAGNRARVSYSAGTMEVEFSGPGTLAVEDSMFCPEFGKKLANRALVWSGQTDGKAVWSCRIASG